MQLQRTPEWYACRLGKATASRMADVVARKRNGYCASRANYMAELLLERITGKRTEGFVSAAMQLGIDTEPEARRAYSFYVDADVEEVGFVPHPTIEMSGASPDGLVGDSGLVEIKVPYPATHLNLLLGAPIEDRYLKQMAFQMSVTGRQWCDFVSYQPSFPTHLQLFVRRIPRDNAMIAELEKEARAFLAELDAKLTQLTSLYEKAA